MRIQHIYVYLRSPIGRLHAVTRQVRKLMSSNPGANVALYGLGFEDNDALLSLEVVVPVSNSAPEAISALQFVHSLNLSFFDYSPFYGKAPSLQEQERLQLFLAQQFEAGDTNARMATKEIANV